MNAKFSERTLTRPNHAHLTQLLNGLQGTNHMDGMALESLEELLRNSERVDPEKVPADLVTMYSQVRLLDTASLARRTFTLGDPCSANPADGLVSVLSPLGLALLGLRAGALAQWRDPQGNCRSAAVEEIVFQQEARWSRAALVEQFQGERP